MRDLRRRKVVAVVHFKLAVVDGGRIGCGEKGLTKGKVIGKGAWEKTNYHFFLLYLFLIIKMTTILMVYYV